MRSSAGQRCLRVLGALCAIAGFLAWIAVAWKAVSDMDGVTPQSGEGGRLMAWAVTGTVLMIAGTIVLHVAHGGSEEYTHRR